PVLEDSASTPVLVSLSVGCGVESWKVWLFSVVYRYGAFHRSVGVVTPVSRAAALETIFAVEPGSKVEETERAKRSSSFAAEGSLGSTERESASVRISPVGTSMTTIAPHGAPISRT